MASSLIVRKSKANLEICKLCRNHMNNEIDQQIKGVKQQTF